MENFKEERQAEVMRRIRSVLAINKEEIPFGTGRPKRRMRIRKDDIMNLKIALNTARFWEEFIFLV